MHQSTHTFLKRFASNNAFNSKIGVTKRNDEEEDNGEQHEDDIGDPLRQQLPQPQPPTPPQSPLTTKPPLIEPSGNTATQTTITSTDTVSPFFSSSEAETTVLQSTFTTTDILSSSSFSYESELSSIQTTFLTATTPTSSSPTISQTSLSITNISLSSSSTQSSLSKTYLTAGTASAEPMTVKSSTHEPDVALKAGVSIAALSCLIALLYLLFRFCPPIRSRWMAWKDKKERENEKRLGLEEMAMPPSVAVPSADAPSTTDTENDIDPRDEGTHGARPPSYRSRYTASGASRVADGWLAVPSRLSHRVVDHWRRSDGSLRRLVLENRSSDSSTGSENNGQNSPTPDTRHQSLGSSMSARVSSMGSDLQQSNPPRTSRFSEMCNLGLGPLPPAPAGGGASCDTHVDSP